MEPVEQAAYRREMKLGAERGTAWQFAAAGVALFGLAARIHNAFAYPPLLDFDGPGHAANVLALHRGELPDALAWAGFHPPLYHALGALLWTLLPTSIPVHVTLRLISGAFGAGAALLAWRGLRGFVAPADAAVAATLAIAAPVAMIAGSMIGNETTCAFFITAALLHFVSIPEDPRGLARHALVTAIPLSLAALTKSTALVAIAASGLLYATRIRVDMRCALVATALVVGIPTAALAPHAVRLLRAGGGSMLSVVSGAAVSRDAREEMAAQPPGVRRLSDYAFVPASTWTEPVYSAPGLVRSVPGLLWASTWADGHAQFLPASQPRVVSAAALTSVAGTIPATLALLGLARVLRDRRAFVAAAGPLLFLALLFVSLLRYTWVIPSFSAVKASYLLSALFPATLLLALGMGGLTPRWRALARAAVLAASLGMTLVFWYGWWN
jgi:hypothetical protein